MTKRMIENRVKKLSALEEQIAQLQEQVDAIKGELKADLEEKGLEELKTKNFLISVVLQIKRALDLQIILVGK